MINIKDYTGKELTIGVVFIIAVCAVSTIFNYIWSHTIDNEKQDLQRLEKSFQFEKEIMTGMNSINLKVENTNTLVKGYDKDFENISTNFDNMNLRINGLSQELITTRESFKNDITKTNAKVYDLRTEFSDLRNEVNTIQMKMRNIEIELRKQ